MRYFSAVYNAFREPDIRNRLLITGMLLLLYKLASVIPVPGITLSMIEQARSSAVAQTTAFQAFNILAGGALANFSIVALSIYPYLAAVEMVNDLTSIIPSLAVMSREPGGQEKLFRIATRLTILFVVFSALVGEDIALPLLNVERSGFLNALTTITALTAGSFFTLWIAQLIDSDGMGNGISLIIFTNIAAALPTFFSNAEAWGLVKTVLIVLTLVVLVPVMIMMREGVRRIPVQYGKRVRGRKPYGDSGTYLPVPIMPDQINTIESSYGYMIFVSSVLLFLIDKTSIPVISDVSAWFLKGWPLLLFFLVLILTFREMAALVEEKNLAEILQRGGGFIPGVRPGRATDEYIHKVTLRLTWITAPFLALLSVLPWLLQQLFGLAEPVYVVPVLWVSIRIIIDLARQLEAHLVMRNYPGFMR
jgi:preprotein translocase subunit SecY